jgi:hypothetical protein
MGPAKRRSAIATDYASSESARTARMTKIESDRICIGRIHSAGPAATPIPKGGGTQHGMRERGITSGERGNGIGDPWKKTYRIRAYQTGDTRSLPTLERERRKKLVLMIYDDAMKTLGHLVEF